jgi:hypothetical protein
MTTTTMILLMLTVTVGSAVAAMWYVKRELAKHTALMSERAAKLATFKTITATMRNQLITVNQQLTTTRDELTRLQTRALAEKILATGDHKYQPTNGVLTSSGFADTLPMDGFRETLPFEDAFRNTSQLPIEGIIDARRLTR